jgi:hypothetical protein
MSYLLRFAKSLFRDTLLPGLLTSLGWNILKLLLGSLVPLELRAFFLFYDLLVETYLFEVLYEF